MISEILCCSCSGAHLHHGQEEFSLSPEVDYTHVICDIQVLLIILEKFRQRNISQVNGRKMKIYKTLAVIISQFHTEKSNAEVRLFVCLPETAFSKSNKPQSQGEPIFAMSEMLSGEHPSPLN